MGNRDDDRNTRPRRVFDRDADMGGSHWSGASGRGGIRVRGPGGEPGYYDRYQQYQGHREGLPDQGRHPEGGYAGDVRYPGDRYHSEGGFIRERGFGHVPGQRWGGGYGGDRDREQRAQQEQHEYEQRQRREQHQEQQHEQRRERHFGNEVDRGGRMEPGGEMTTGRGYWPGWYPEPVTGAGYDQGSDMGMGAPNEDDRGPHYGKGPKGYKRSDDRTREDVCDAIAHQGYIDASDVEVTVEDGVVTLSGTVAQRHHKRALEQLVERCRGVDEVHNELRLKREGVPARAEKDKSESRAESKAESGEHKNGKSARS